jgi:uncharacterized protein YwgA
MATNTKYKEIINKVFKGNVGKQIQLIWLRNEVDRFLANNPTPNSAQQEYCDAIINEYEMYAEQIRGLLNIPKIEDIQEPETTEEV